MYHYPACMLFILYLILFTEIVQNDMLEALTRMPDEEKRRLQHRRRRGKTTTISNVMDKEARVTLYI